MREFLMNFENRLRRWWLAVIVVVLGLILTAMAAVFMKISVEKVAQGDFTAHCNEIYQAISNRLDDHARILLSGVALFNSSDAVTREKWRVFNRIQQVDKQLPGIQGIGFSLLIPRAELAGHIQTIRSEGFPDYKVKPEGDRDVYSSIIYLEPFKDRNLRAFGYDMFSEPVRRAAMERARDTDAAALSGKVVLVQETGKEVQAGTLMYVPVYCKGMPTESIAQRRAALYGWVYSPYRMNDLMRGMLGSLLQKKEQHLFLRVYDGEPSTASLLFEDRPANDPLARASVRFSKQSVIDFNGHRWTLSFTQTGGGMITREYMDVWLTLAGGLLITFLLFALIAALLNTRARALEMAQELTATLRASKEDLTLILASVGEAIYGIDLDGRCTFCNPACLGMLKYKDTKELIGKNMHWQCHHSHADGTPFAVEQCRIFKAFQLGQGTHVDDEVLWRSDGSSFPAEYWSFPQWQNGKVVGAVVTFVDITERKKVAKALSESKERFRQIASAITDYIYTVYIENGQPVRTKYNSACLAVTGYTTEEYLLDPMLWIKVVLEEDRPLVTRQIAEIFTGAKMVAPIEHRIIRKDGRICWVQNTIVLHYDSQGALVSYDGLISDITARRAAEKVLEDQKKALDEHAIVSRSDISGHITYVNDRFCQISKYSREELIGQDHRMVNSAYHPKNFFTTMWRTISDGKVWQGNVRNKAKDGSFYWIQATIVPFMDEYGKVKEYISAQTDITRNIENEERLEQAMQARSNFVSTVSHELRTPLASIKSSVDILSTESPGKLTGDQKTFLGRVKSNIDRLARLINDVLDISKLEAGKMTINMLPHRVEEIVREVVEMHRTVIRGKPVTLEMKLDNNLPIINCDKDRLTQVFNNLIGNSLKFTQAGSVTVLVSCEDSKTMTFVIRDTGPGIRPEDLPKLFQKFQQVGGVSQQISGTGLGLAISKEIIELHGGCIWVESEFGRGSSFMFTLPVKQHHRILVVDDDAGTRQVLKAALESVDLYKVELAEDGFAAGQKYLEFAPHLIILDIGLPKLSGLEVCARLKGDPKTRQTKIMMFSSFTDETRKKSWDAGADEVLNKPVDAEELLSKVKSLL